MRFLFVMEMATNHKGSLDRGKKIISEFHEVTKNFTEMDFAFKFQRRNLEKLIHKDYIDTDEIPYIKKFRETQLKLSELKELVDYAKSLGYATACTPFDEVSVDEIKTLNLDYVKIGSCSINDWPLLNKVAELNLPVIASTGGIGIGSVETVVEFFEHRDVDLSLMHCVGLYPAYNSSLSLNRIDTLKRLFPTLKIGFSSHEDGCSGELSTAIAIAKGATIFERHVDIVEQSNSYSSLPPEYQRQLWRAEEAITSCKNQNTIVEENKKLNTFKRGAYLNCDVKKYDKITPDMLSFQMPILDKDHVTVFECNKYTCHQTYCDIKKGEPLRHSCAGQYSIKQRVLNTHNEVEDLLLFYNIVVPANVQMEISHHYGLEKFDKYGMSIITLINEKYCKKLLVLLPEQTNPEHFHKIKSETFFVIGGNVEIVVNGTLHSLKRGDLLTISPNEVHSIYSPDGAVIEELSTKHQSLDSFYTDEKINENTNRKTVIYL